MLTRTAALDGTPKAMTPWQTLLSIDFDKWAAETYRANFPGVRVECGPVADFIDQLPDADAVLGGPPCQPHSLAGKRQASSDKRDCGPDFVAAVAKVKPRMFLMENVNGLMSSENGAYAARLLASMEAAGYVVQIQIIDAVAFGVPQFRVRCWWWGIRRDLYIDGLRHRWPHPTHQWPAPTTLSLFGGELLSGVTVGEALGITDCDIHRRRGAGLIERDGERRDVPCTEPSPSVGTGWDRQILLQSHADPAQTIHRPSPSLRSGGAGHDGCCLRLQYDHGVAVPDEPAPTLKAGGNFDATGKQGGGCPPMVLYRWSDAMLQKHPPASPASPAPTVQAKWFKGGAEGLLRWKQTEDGLWVRRLTPLECLRLQSGGDDFRWADGISKTQMYRIVGNGWACGMAAVMSRALKAADPQSHTVIDLFCGGGLGATGWHQRYWSYERDAREAGAA